ncbi:hypothetical protein GCM10009810_12760 [Nostocoides vanveenii]|uniref:Uncharacterized protein n=1 Tax=Nostocoides vanveenii TaxID=330835 RepID=A0ABP4WGM9_9MICO
MIWAESLLHLWGPVEHRPPLRASQAQAHARERHAQRRTESRGAGDLHPYKETSSHKGTCPQADLSQADPLPSCGDSAAAEPPAPAWSEVTDAESVLALVKRSLDRRALREWSSSRQREAQQGLQAWMVGSGASAQEALYFVSAWVADRRLANCNFVTEWLTRHAEQAAAIRNLLHQADPTSVIVAGHEDGLEWRRRRLRKAG